MMVKQYKVGRGRPPKHTRWKKGQSGNPAGRPPRPRPSSFEDIIAQELDREVSIQENGRQVLRPARVLVVRAMVAKAAKGDVRALEWLTKHAPKSVFQQEIEVRLEFDGETEQMGARISELQKRLARYEPEDWCAELEGEDGVPGSPDEGDH